MQVYINHLIRHVSTSPATMVISLIYTERLLERLGEETGAYLFTSQNSHRIILTAFLLAHKFTTDARISQKYFAQSGGVTKEELQTLETEFLKTVDWNLSVSEEIFDMYLHAVTLFFEKV